MWSAFNSVLTHRVRRTPRRTYVLRRHRQATSLRLPRGLSPRATNRQQKMDSLTEIEISQIARQQREAGVQSLSCHFSWPEFCNEQRCFHQEFVYDVTMFAAACGLPWLDVIQAAVMAKNIFPKLDGMDAPELLSMLGNVLSEYLPNLSSVHRPEFIRFLTDMCITRYRLFQAVVGGATNMSITQLNMEVQLPPAPCPLAQGESLLEWDHQYDEAELKSMLLQKEEELTELRNGSRITLGEVNIPEDRLLDKEGLVAAVHAAVETAKEEVLMSLSHEAYLLVDILQLKMQQAAMATRGLQNAVPSSKARGGSHPEAPAKATKSTAKKEKQNKTKPKESRKAV